MVAKYRDDSLVCNHCYEEAVASRLELSNGAKDMLVPLQEPPIAA